MNNLNQKLGHSDPICGVSMHFEIQTFEKDDFPELSQNTKTQKTVSVKCLNLCVYNIGGHKKIR